MPSCLVNKCVTHTGKKEQSPDIMLHRMPKDPARIRSWLLQTGQTFQNLDRVIELVMEGQKTNKYFMCSLHFTSDSYTTSYGKIFLKEDAIPSNFEGFLEGEKVIEENLKKISIRAKKRSLMSRGDSDATTSSHSSSSCQQTTLETQFEICKHGFCNIGTQTDYTMSNSYVEYYAHADEPFQSPILPTASTPLPQAGRIRLMDNIFDASPLRKKAHIKTVLFREIEEENNMDLGVSPIHYLDETEESIDFIEKNKKVEHVKKGEESYIPGESSLEQTDLSFQGVENIMQEEDQTNSDEKIVNDRKLIIYESCLDKLLYSLKCLSVSNCNSKFKIIKKTFDGSACKITGTCFYGHKILLLETHPKINRYSAGNVMLAASILFSGLNFTKVKELFDIFGLIGISEKSFYRYQSNFLFPAIDSAWLKEKEKLEQELMRKELCIAGDGQCDSPGHSAKYCAYTVMDTVSGKILDFEMVQRSQCSSSTAMEKFGFGIVMDRLLQKGFKVRVFASDRHIGIRQKMKTDYSNIEHQFDIWHYAKSIRKKLIEANRVKACKEITPWIDRIVLHFWWCVNKCQRDHHLLEEKWLSVLHHIVDRHEWQGTLYSKCSHGPLDDQDKTYFWLDDESLAYQKIETIVCNKQILKDLPHLKHNCHTGMLENFHSLVLKYRTKRIHYGIDAMEARTKLAILTHNKNVGRQQAVVRVKKSTSEEIGSKRTALVLSKSNSKWFVRDLYEKMNVDYLEQLSIDVLKIVRGEKNTSWVSRAPGLPPNLANIERPNKEELKKRRICRFRPRRAI